MMKTNFLSQLLYRFQNTRLLASLDGRGNNNFYHRNTSTNHNFKPNQRKECSVSKQRRMKTNSR